MKTNAANIEYSAYIYLNSLRIAKCFTNSSKRFRCEVMF
jgi:hypothetical protein